MLHFVAMRRSRRWVPESESILESTGQPRMDQALREAPQRFAQARRVEEIRRKAACVHCGEPSAVQCEGCGSRVCVAHTETHACLMRGA